MIKKPKKAKYSEKKLKLKPLKPLKKPDLKVKKPKNLCKMKKLTKDSLVFH